MRFTQCEEGNSAVGAPLMINLPVTEANKKLYWGFCPSGTMHHNVTSYFVGFLINAHFLYVLQCFVVSKIHCVWLVNGELKVLFECVHEGSLEVAPG